MFDQALLQLPSYALKRGAITAALSKAHEAGTLTYTDIMLAPQEVYTIAFEILDGVEKNNNIPQYAPEGRQFDFGPVRLCTVDTEPHHRMKTYRWKTVVIPGTNIVAPNKVEVVTDHGFDWTTDDRLEDGRPARRLLIDSGWPIRQMNSLGGTLGHIVEMKWLERICASPDVTEEYTSLLAAIKAREPARTKTDKPAPAQGARQQENRP